MYIPGCPISPEALIDGIVALLEEAGQDTKADRLAAAKPEIVEKGKRIDQAVAADPENQEGTDESEPVEA